MKAMSQGLLKSPNDSVMQSTTLPSTRSGENMSLDAGSFTARQGFSGAGGQIGGGSLNSYMADHVSRLHEDIRGTTRKLELEQRRLYKIDKDLESAEAEYKQKRLRYRAPGRPHGDAAGGDGPGQSQNKLLHRAGNDAFTNKLTEVRVLERHLEKAIAELNKGVADNEDLREKIDELRKERKILNTTFKQLERGISRSGRALNELMMRINSDRLSSEEASQKMRARTKVLERERKEFHKDMEGARETLKEEAGVQRAQEVRARHDSKSSSAGATDNPSKRGRRKTYVIADEEEAFSEVAIKRRILKLSFLNAIQRRHIKQHQKNIEVFEQAFATIRSTTGIGEIDEIVKIFIGLEQRNFSLLNYVNQLNRDIETIELKYKAHKDQWATHNLQEAQGAAKREAAMSDLSTQISRTQVATKETNTASEDLEKMLEEVRPRIWSIVKSLSQKVPRLLKAAYQGDVRTNWKNAVPDEQEANLNTYLTYIEEALMQFRVCLQMQALTSQPPGKSGAGMVKRPTDLPSSLHGAGDDSDDEMDMVAPSTFMTRSELKEKAQATIQRRRKKPGQKGPDAIDEGVPDTTRKPGGFARQVSSRDAC